VVGAGEDGIEWVMEREEATAEEVIEVKAANAE
jgi:hypothetical protein